MKMTLISSSCRCQRIYGSSRDSWRTRIPGCTRKQRGHGNSRSFSIKPYYKFIELYRSICTDLSSYCKHTTQYLDWCLFFAIPIDFSPPQHLLDLQNAVLPLSKGNITSSIYMLLHVRNLFLLCLEIKSLAV